MGIRSPGVYHWVDLPIDVSLNLARAPNAIFKETCDGFSNSEITPTTAKSR